ncbi:MAG: amidohydrolase [bacterium]|nr:amidohydrolase [bacterium]
MNRFVAIVSVLLAAVAAGAAAIPEESDTMVRIYTGPVFWTGDPALPEAAAVAVSADGRILETYGVVPRDTPWEIVVLPGALALPGLHDAHLHVSGIGKRCEQAALEGAGSALEARDLVAAWAAANPDVAVVRGRGWDQSRWPGGAFPTWRDLEGAGSRPIVLRRVDGHASWVNRALLDLAGITAATPDPEGGRILRDAQGEPTGVLVDNAADLLTPVLPRSTTADQERWLLAGLAACADAGLTAVHDMGQTPETCDIAQRLADEGRLPIRLFVYLEGSETGSMAALGRYRAADRFAVRGMKYYTDGALGSRGALLLADYSDEPGRRGLAVTDAPDLADLVREVHRRGFQCAIHAIGDGGNRMALDAIAAAQAPDPSDTPPRRHRVEHAQVVHPDDFARFAALGALASVQPTHCTSDLRWAEQRLGPDRVRGAYAWRTFLDHGVHLPLGSDAPVEDWNPLPGVYAAITRQEPDGDPAGGWHPEQILTLDEALRGFTAEAAYAVGRESDLGALRPGLLFDCTVLDRDPRGGDPVRWLAAKPSALFVGGERVR